MARNKWDDHYARRAKKEKWLARSVYKLQEIDNKYKLIRTGDRILDLGCYPGSWAQYAIKKTGSRGEVVGIDLSEPTRISFPNFRFIRGDVLGLDLEGLARDLETRDLVMSDLAPKTSGIKDADAGRSLALAVRALDIGSALLKEDGHFLCKILEGGDLATFKSGVSNLFRRVKLFRPKATRKRSREVYVIGMHFMKTEPKGG